MFLNSSLSGALDRIAERADDVRRAYTPGAVPQYDDVATPSTATDFTLDPLAVLAPDGAYFITNDDRGRRAYTRDGSLAVRDGGLVDADGRPILGLRTPGTPYAQLCVDPVDYALGRVRDAHVDRDGSFVYFRETLDPRSGNRESQRVVVGRIALARFPAGTRLETTDGSHGVAPPGVAAQAGLPDDGSFGALVPMRRERSRIDVDESLVRLKEAYLAFDALQAAEAARAHLGKTAMDLLK
jgi:flagellar basal body rod protein FlgG